MLLFMIAAVLPLCISGQLTTPEEDAAILFLEVDRNGDKVVQMSELIFYFDQMDADQDGGISRHEFALYWEAEYPEIPSQAIHALFDLFDFNTDHHLVLTDLTNFYPVMNTDDDIAVTEQEFLVYWTARFHELGTHVGK